MVGVDRIDLPRVGGEVLVRQLRALRRPRRAAGVLEQRDVAFGVDRAGIGPAVIVGEGGKTEYAPIAGQRSALAPLEHATSHRLPLGTPAPDSTEAEPERERAGRN